MKSLRVKRVSWLVLDETTSAGWIAIPLRSFLIFGSWCAEAVCALLCTLTEQASQ